MKNKCSCSQDPRDFACDVCLELMAEDENKILIASVEAIISIAKGDCVMSDRSEATHFASVKRSGVEYIAYFLITPKTETYLPSPKQRHEE